MVELAAKYNFTIDEERSIQREALELRAVIRKDLKKKLKIKSGYSRIKSVTSDRRQNEFLRFELSDLNEQIADLQEDLQTLEMYNSAALGKQPTKNMIFWFNIFRRGRDVSWESWRLRTRERRTTNKARRSSARTWERAQSQERAWNVPERSARQVESSRRLTEPSWGQSC